MSEIALKEITEDELHLLVEHRNQWDTRRWLEFSGTITDEGQREWLRNHGAAFRLAWASEGFPVGLARVSLIHGDAEIGCDVFKDYRRAGYGSLIFAALLDKAGELGAKTASLWVFLDNAPAMKIYAKNGFEIDPDAPARTYFRPSQEGSKMLSPRFYIRMAKRLR